MNVYHWFCVEGYVEDYGNQNNTNSLALNKTDSSTKKTELSALFEGFDIGNKME